MAKKVRVSGLNSLWVGPCALLEMGISIRDSTIHGSILRDAGTAPSTHLRQQKLPLFLVHSANIKPLKLNDALGWPKRKWLVFSCRNKTNVVPFHFSSFAAFQGKTQINEREILSLRTIIKAQQTPCSFPMLISQ